MSRRRYQITASTFDIKGKPIATGVNNYKKSHPLMKHFALLAGESEEKHFQHAELAAMLESRTKKVHSILVQRFDAEGKTKIAKPCPTCQKMLKAFGVKVVRYTSDKGIEEYEN